LVDQNIRLDETVAANYFRQILEIITFCHQKKVSLGHNIKLMNYVFDSESQDTIRMDLLDNPMDITEGNEAIDRHYHPAYCPPEAIPFFGVAYDSVKADAWAAGILLYKMVTGVYPFMDLRIRHQFFRICHEPLPLPSFLSPSLKALLHLLLRKDWSNRSDLSDAIFHPWVRNAPCKEDLKSLDFNHSLLSIE
jgi:serine/threonine protein kinase